MEFANSAKFTKKNHTLFGKGFMKRMTGFDGVCMKFICKIVRVYVVHFMKVVTGNKGEILLSK